MEYLKHVAVLLECLLDFRFEKNHQRGLEYFDKNWPGVSNINQFVCYHDYHFLFESMESNHSSSLRNAPRPKHNSRHFPQQAESVPQLERSPDVPETSQINFQLVSGSLILESEFNSQVYCIRSDLLSRSSISELVRAKLRAWIYEECSRLKLSRRICCLSATLIDLFFNRGGDVTIENFHSMGLSCLLLANKLTDNYFIPVDNRVFPSKEIREWEQKICLKLTFKLNPITYVDYMDGLLAMWNQFASIHDLWAYKGFGKEEKLKIHDSRRCFQILDLVYLMLKSYSFPKGLIEWQVLRLILEADGEGMEKIDSVGMSIEDEVLISFWDNPQQTSLRHAPFEKIFKEFQLHLGRLDFFVPPLEYTRREQVCLWLKEVLSQGANLSSEGESEIWCQTRCEGWFPLVRQILRSRLSKNSRKGSSDTTA